MEYMAWKKRVMAWYLIQAQLFWMQQDNFNYSIDCGIGEVILGGESYSSLGVSREIDNDAEKKMELDCGVGQIHVEYR